MRKILATLATVAVLAAPSTLAVVNAPPALAHGSCQVKSTLTMQAVVGGVVPRMDASTACTDIHVSTTIEIFLRLNNSRGPVVYYDIKTEPDSRTVAITRYYGGGCSDGQRYILQAFGWARQDKHLLAMQWSKVLTCPITV